MQLASSDGACACACVWRRSVLVCASLVLAAVAAGAATLPAGFTETQITGLSSPTAMAFAPDGRLFVCQQGGSLRVIKNGALLATPFLTVTVSSSGERGLLGLAFDPNFATNNFLYVYYTATTPAIHNRVSRFMANGDVVVAGSETVLLDLNNLSGATNHNGGAMHFGPDGKLYIAVGENANSANSQSFGNLLGKMLRINTDPANLIPTDNPYFNDANVTGNNKVIWALGLRNPYTFAFQPGTGRILINDVGQNTYEEINEGVAHSNYGWPICEGLVCGGTAPTDYRAPIYVYAHTTGTPTGCAITGGTFYNPPTVQFPSTYVGQYFFADYCGNFIRYINPTTAPPIPASTGFATGISGPVDLQVASDGSLWYLAINTGSVGRIQYPAGQVPPTIAQPPQSQTIAAGQPVTFTVGANGTPPFSYQWQRNTVNIAGANAASYTIPAVAAGDNGAQFRCVVTNAFGNATSNSATLTVTSNTPPSPVINAPVAGTLYNAGDTINYSGSATDTEDGPLPAAAFTWSVVFHHDTHTHPFLPPTSGATSGSFVIPTLGETAANVWYRIHLVVTDSGGLATEITRDIFPRTATLTFATNPAGLSITLDGQSHTDGYAELNVVNIQRTLGVVPQQTLNGVTYNFLSWSDGGAATHNVNVPASNTTYTANFARAANVGDLIISEFRNFGPDPQGPDPSLTGAKDDFVELYNNTNAAITVSTAAGSAGWALVSANGTTLFVIPNGTTIPAHGHYLAANPAEYSLGAYATPDINFSADLTQGIALFNTANAANFNLANRLDAAGFSNDTGVLASLTHEGTAISAQTGQPVTNEEFSYVRKLATGTAQDTDDNANDFVRVCTCIEFAGQTQGVLGTPGPENLASPIQRNAQLKASLIEPQQPSTTPPNRVRDTTTNGCGGPNCALGTLDIRRRFKNSTGLPVTALRFRVVDITTLNTPNPGGTQADLRLLTSGNLSLNTSLGNLTVKGTLVEQPLAQAGGGLNTSALVNLGGQLAPGATIDIRLLLGVQTGGNFRFLVNVEAVTAASGLGKGSRAASARCADCKPAGNL